MIANTTKINEGDYCSDGCYNYCKCVTYSFVVDIGSLNLSLTSPRKKSFYLLQGLLPGLDIDIMRKISDME